jgi:tetratricopeptide (TPR) repeat protein
MDTKETPLAPEYRFYVPPEGRSVTVGADEQQVPLPQIHLPVERAGLDGEPSDKQLGVSLYNYLRRFPDCPCNVEYAQLLQQAFPYYLADIGSQIIMLEAKDVDAPYIRRKISYLKILVLLSPENPQLLQKLGVAFFELGMIYVELIHIRREFCHAVTYLQRSLDIAPQDTTTLNVLGQICYLMGDYPAVLRYWQGVVDLIPDCAAREELRQRLSRITKGQTPQTPLIDDLEAVGIAAEHFAANEFEAASEIMNRLEEEAVIPEELPNPEFFYFLGLCREKSDELSGAFEAYSKALQIDPEHQASADAIARIQTDPAE